MKKERSVNSSDCSPLFHFGLDTWHLDAPRAHLAEAIQICLSSTSHVKMAHFSGCKNFEFCKQGGSELSHGPFQHRTHHKVHCYSFSHGTSALVHPRLHRLHHLALSDPWLRCLKTTRCCSSHFWPKHPVLFLARCVGLHKFLQLTKVSVSVTAVLFHQLRIFFDVLSKGLDNKRNTNNKSTSLITQTSKILEEKNIQASSNIQKVALQQKPGKK